jgi:LysR family hydrogen peroxide-inducible transcriptional activator
VTVYHPTLKQLQYLVALHEHGHFGRAADALSSRNRRCRRACAILEALLGVVLVERTKRAVRFTPLGNAVVAKAHRILREAEELSDLVQSSGQPLSGEVRMSVIPTIAPFLLPRMLPRLRRERPNLKLFLREEPSAAAIESLHHGPRRLRAARPALSDRRGGEGDDRTRRLLRRVPARRSAQPAR